MSALQGGVPKIEFAMIYERLQIGFENEKSLIKFQTKRRLCKAIRLASGQRIYPCERQCWFIAKPFRAEMGF